MNDRVISWAGLLAKWTEFAQSAMALPRTSDGERMRACVPAIIGLQAIIHALAELDSLPADEYALGQDRAEVVTRRHIDEIHGAWAGEPLPEGLAELIGDARGALRATRQAGLEWRVAEGPLVAEHGAEVGLAILSAGFSGDLFLPAPGVPLFAGCPAGFMKTPSGVWPEAKFVRLVREFLKDVSSPVRSRSMRQVYRQFDFGTGRVRRDLVVGLESELPGGQPLLVPVILAGELQPVPMPPPPGYAPESVKVVFEEGWE